MKYPSSNWMKIMEERSNVLNEELRARNSIGDLVLPTLEQHEDVPMSSHDEASTEPLSSIPSVTTIAPGSNIFERSAVVFAIPGENQMLQLPSDNFQPTSSKCADVDALVNDTHLTDNIVPENTLNQDKPAEEIPPQRKKRRGGWPKGKKRKKECLELNKPKTPVAGHVRFINSRRAHVKAQYPNLSSIQITKFIGAEWNTLSAAEKQVYHDEAEDDKKRYLDELVAYQHTEAYQQFLKRQQTKKLKEIVGVDNLEGLDPNFLTDSFDEGHDSSGLYCKLCNQHFSSEHNKKGHMLGKQHLQMITEEFEKDTQAMLRDTDPEPEQDESLEPSGQEAEDNEMCEPTKLNTLSEVMETLLQHNYEREMEIRELKRNLGDSENQRMLLCKELENLEKRVLATEESLNASKLLGSTLTNQLDDLRVVPSIFGVML